MKKIVYMLLLVFLVVSCPPPSSSPRPSWNEIKHIIASHGFRFDRFGANVTISSDGSTIVVSAGIYYDRDTNFNIGEIFVYKRNGNSWIETRISASDVEMWDCFGSSVSLSADGSVIVVGAKRNDLCEGSAYVYRWNGSSWVEEIKLSASDGIERDLFGYSVSISADGNIIVVGAPDDDIGANNDQGSAYIYEYK